MIEYSVLNRKKGLVSKEGRMNRRMNIVKKIKLYIESRCGKLAEYYAIVLAITYIIASLAYGASFETIYVSALFTMIAITLIAVQTLEAAVRNCVCHLGSARKLIFAISFLGIIATFYLRLLPQQYAYDLLMFVWPIIFAVPTSYIITVFATIMKKNEKGNITD